MTAPSNPIDEELGPNALDELFEKDPNEHTPEERTAILMALRDAKDRWFIEEETSRKAGKRSPNYRKGASSPRELKPIKDLKTKEAKARRIADEMDLDLGDL